MLQTIPWHLVDIEMVSVETDLAGLVMPGSRQEIIHYVKSQGSPRREILRAEESLRLFTCGVHGSTSTVGEVKDDLFVFVLAGISNSPHVPEVAIPAACLVVLY